MTEQWICVCKNFDDLPFIVSSEKEARELLESWNENELDDEGKVSKVKKVNYVWINKTYKIKKMFLTTDMYDKDDPFGVATLYDYDEILKE